MSAAPIQSSQSLPSLPSMQPPPPPPSPVASRPVVTADTSPPSAPLKSYGKDKSFKEKTRKAPKPYARAIFMLPPDVGEEQNQKMTAQIRDAQVGDVFRIEWHKIGGEKTQREMKKTKLDNFDAHGFLGMADLSNGGYKRVNAKGLRTVQFLRHE